MYHGGPCLVGPLSQALASVQPDWSHSWACHRVSTTPVCRGSFTLGKNQVTHGTPEFYTHLCAVAVCGHHTPWWPWSDGRNAHTICACICGMKGHLGDLEQLADSCVWFWFVFSSAWGWNLGLLYTGLYFTTEPHPGHTTGLLSFSGWIPPTTVILLHFFVFYLKDDSWKYC